MRRILLGLVAVALFSLATPSSATETVQRHIPGRIRLCDDQRCHRWPVIQRLHDCTFTVEMLNYEPATARPLLARVSVQDDHGDVWIDLARPETRPLFSDGTYRWSLDLHVETDIVNLDVHVGDAEGTYYDAFAGAVAFDRTDDDCGGD